MREELISFENCRGDRLSGVVHHPVGAVRGAVILCHGMESSKNSEKLVYLGRALAARDFLALRFDFSCAGESSGRFEDLTYTGEVDDLRAAYAVVRERNAAKVGIFGSSMGGTVALLFGGGEPSVDAIVTLAAPLHPERFPERMLTPAQVEDWRQRGFVLYNGRRLNASLLKDLEQMNVRAAAARIACPVLIIHGDADQIVPVEEAHELARCINGLKRLIIVQGGDHRLSSPAAMELALAEALDWLAEHVQ